MLVKGVVFGILSAGVFLKFRKELFDFRRHGPYVLAAFQGLLSLFFFNWEAMFRDPFTVRQLVSWGLMAASATLAASGFFGLLRHGRAVGDWENTTRLVREGVFRYIRHPLYGSLMLLAIGVMLKEVSFRAVLTCLWTLGFLAAASGAEERENGEKFGAEYERYSLRTRRYLPFIV